MNGSALFRRVLHPTSQLVYSATGEVVQLEHESSSRAPFWHRWLLVLWHWRDRRLVRVLGNETTVYQTHTSMTSRWQLWAWLIVSQDTFFNIWRHVGPSPWLARYWIMSLLVTGWLVARWRAERITLTPTRVIVSEGLLRQHTHEESLEGLRLDPVVSYFTLISRLWVLEFKRGTGERDAPPDRGAQRGQRDDGQLQGGPASMTPSA